jgi:hypothetical protein
MTAMPAKRFGLTARGLIHKGYYADLVVFNAEIIKDTATFADPVRLAAGIEGVWVNGFFHILIKELRDIGPGGFYPAARLSGSNNSKTGGSANEY